jgi:GT2 family glycosyltransferase
MSHLVSVIIPNWNGRKHLETCLESLRNQDYQSVEIILVDNGSTDGSISFVQQSYPEVRLVELDSNRGFTGAGNAGCRVAKGDIIVLLNNDTEVEFNWLTEITSAFDRHPEVGAVASKILLYNKRDHFHTAGDYYRVDGIPGNRGVWQKDQGQYDRESFVFSACGAAAAYRRELIEEIGFLDDSFYFSCEDVDLGWRIQLAGWKVIYSPTAVVYHKLKATGEDAIASYYDGRNFLYVIWKNYPTSILKEYWPKIIRGQLQIAKEALLTWRGKAARARIKGQFAGLFGVTKMWSKRRKIQANRQVSDEILTGILTPVDDATLGSYDSTMVRHQQN